MYGWKLWYLCIYILWYIILENYAGWALCFLHANPFTVGNKLSVDIVFEGGSLLQRSLMLFDPIGMRRSCQYFSKLVTYSVNVTFLRNIGSHKYAEWYYRLESRVVVKVLKNFIEVVLGNGSICIADFLTLLMTKSFSPADLLNRLNTDEQRNLESKTENYRR